MEKEKLKVTEGHCPYCGSDNMDTEKTVVEGNMTTNNCYCLDCKRNFTQVYRTQQVFIGQDVGEDLDI